MQARDKRHVFLSEKSKDLWNVDILVFYQLLWSRKQPLERIPKVVLRPLAFLLLTTVFSVATGQTKARPHLPGWDNYVNKMTAVESYDLQWRQTVQILLGVGPQRKSKLTTSYRTIVNGHQFARYKRDSLGVRRTQSDGKNFFITTYTVQGDEHPPIVPDPLDSPLPSVRQDRYATLLSDLSKDPTLRNDQTIMAVDGPVSLAQLAKGLVQLNQLSAYDVASRA
jgi:hypothetical protein